MGLLGKIKRHFLTAGFSEQLLYFEVFFLAMYYRFLMLHVKFKRYESSMGKRLIETQLPYPDHQHEEIQKIRSIVQAVCKHTPWESKCMVEALTTKHLLKKRGIESTIYFGMRKKASSAKDKAHAWLRVGDKIIMGFRGHQQFNVVNYYT